MTTIAGGLISLEFAAAGLKYKNVGTQDQATRDADLTAYVQAATPVIEDIAGKQSLSTYTHLADGGVASIVLPNAAASIVSVTENGAVTTDYMWDTRTQIVYAGSLGQRYFAFGQKNGIAITYTVGNATIPMYVQLATRELVRFWVQQGNSAQVPGYNDAVEATVFTPQGFAVPKRVMELLAAAPARRLGGFA